MFKSSCADSFFALLVVFLLAAGALATYTCWIVFSHFLSQMFSPVLMLFFNSFHALAIADELSVSATVYLRWQQHTLDAKGWQYYHIVELPLFAPQLISFLVAFYCCRRSHFIKNKIRFFLSLPLSVKLVVFIEWHITSNDVFSFSSHCRSYYLTFKAFFVFIFICLSMAWGWCIWVCELANLICIWKIAYSELHKKIEVERKSVDSGEMFLFSNLIMIAMRKGKWKIYSFD